MENPGYAYEENHNCETSKVLSSLETLHFWSVAKLNKRIIIYTLTWNFQIYSVSQKK